MKVKGIELFKMIVEGKVNQHTRVSVDNYNDCSLDFVFEDGRNIFKWLDEDFEILEDKTEEIEEIGFTPDEWYELNNSTFKITRKFIEEQNNKINELVREINQIKKDLKPLAIGVDYGNDCDKETNCMTD